MKFWFCMFDTSILDVVVSICSSWVIISILDFRGGCFYMFFLSHIYFRCGCYKFLSRYFRYYILYWTSWYFLWQILWYIFIWDNFIITRIYFIYLFILFSTIYKIHTHILYIHTKIHTYIYAYKKKKQVIWWKRVYTRH
jgi:hypothetical protein